MVLMFDYIYNSASSYVFNPKDQSSGQGPSTSTSTATTKSSKKRGRNNNGASSSGLHGSGHARSKSFRASLSKEDAIKYDLVDSINDEVDLYKVLGLRKDCKVEEIRRAYIGRSRVCHPDKFPSYPPSTSAFQKLSFAYETLSKPSSRRLYDISGRADWASADAAASARGGRASSGGFGDETLNGVLYTMFCEFMEGDFEMIRVLVNALNEGNPGLNLGEDAIENLEGAFKKMRELMLAGQKYLRIVKFELIRLYEIQHSLRQLSYFDVLGRLRLTLQLARVTLSIPMAIDKAMKDGDTDSEDEDVTDSEDGEEWSEEDEEEEEGEGEEGWNDDESGDVLDGGGDGTAFQAEGAGLKGRGGDGRKSMDLSRSNSTSTTPSSSPNPDKDSSPSSSSTSPSSTHGTPNPDSNEKASTPGEPADERADGEGEEKRQAGQKRRRRRKGTPPTTPDVDPLREQQGEKQQQSTSTSNPKKKKKRTYSSAGGSNGNASDPNKKKSKKRKGGKEKESRGKEVLSKRGLLPASVAGVLGLAVGVLERGERFI